MPFWDKWLDSIAQWIAGNGWNDRPESALVITLIAIMLSIFSTFVTRLLTNQGELKESMQKVNDWNQRRKRAMQTADKKLWLTVKRDEERVKKMQSSMMFKRMKPMLFTTIPFLLLFAILRRAYTGHYYAWLPFNLGQFPWIGAGWTAPYQDPATGVWYAKVPFTLWYFITAFAFGSLISRLFGVTPSGATQTKKKPKQEQKRTPTPTSITKEKLARTKQVTTKDTAKK